MQKSNNILLLYVCPLHHGIVERLSDEMEKYGIFIDVLDLVEYGCYRKTSIKWPYVITILNYLFRHFKILFKIYRELICRFPILQKIFYHIVIFRIIDRYKYVDFHYYSSEVDMLALYCHQKGIKYDIMLWGSDLLRASEERRYIMKQGFSHAHYIKSMKSVLDVLSKVYQGEFDDRAAYVDFGNVQFEYIDAITEENYKKIETETYPNCKKPIVITLGYNGSRYQNHFVMIDAINQLPQKYKNLIHIIIPLTYGCDNVYIHEINSAIKNTGVSYTVPTKYMGHDEIAVLRKKSDITINIQDTDAFSLSLQEHLYCGNVMIIADWLNYPELRDADIFYVKTRKENLPFILRNVIDEYENYKELSASNKDKIERVISWKYISKIWERLYKK